MNIDLTGGLPAEREHVFPEAPSTPHMRDAVNMWISDDRGELSLPRFAVEAAMPDWDRHSLQLNVVFADGRAYRLRDDFPSLPAAGPDGRPTVLGAGPLVFGCTEPFRTWTATYRGSAVETSSEALAGGDTTGPVVDLEFDVTTTMAAPPWIQGTMSSDAAEMLSGSTEGKLMGGQRYEQLCRAQGTVRVAGSEHHFSGNGLRIRRQGVRELTEFRGHAWQSALFPGGKGFGYIAYPDRSDGATPYNEGYLFLGDGDLIPARVVDAPWLVELDPSPHDVSLKLESKLGVTEIEAEAVMSSFDLRMDGLHPDLPVLEQSSVRYRWDDEESYGMLERSSLRERIEGL